MNQVIFNFHDVILLMTSTLCGLFALFLLAVNTNHKLSHHCLAAFLLVHAFVPLNELILWGAVFKLRIREYLPQIDFACGFAYYIDGALLFLYINSLVYQNFRLRKKDYAHLLPLIIYVIFMLLAFYRYPYATRMDWVRNETFTYSQGYVVMDFLCRTLRAVYCLLCFNLILRYKDILKATRSNIQKTNIVWLKLLVVGFLIVTSLEALVSFSKIVGVFWGYEFQHSSFNIYEIIGLTSYYAGFVLVSTLVFTSLRYFNYFDSVKPNDEQMLQKTKDEKWLNPEIATKIDQMMRSLKPYLSADLTINSLARSLGMPARDLSFFINRHFTTNFWEFVNRYRIEEAKILLLSPEQKTITDIYLEVGFSSKSVFNAFFKKQLGVTPSQYRQQYLAK